MHPLRTRFKKEIVCEFLPPARKSDKVIIFCAGMPSVPAKSLLLNYYAKRGYWIFFPRYRGSWESDGEFLRLDPTKDIIDIIDELPKGFKDYHSDKLYKLKPKQIIVIGSSFGGPAAILASKDSRVDKAIAVAPVIDWRVEGKDEPMDWMEKFLGNAFGQAYRFSHANWKKLKKGNFYNPISEADKLNGKKIVIFQAKDDKSVPFRPAVKFSRLTGCKLFLYKRGGHGISKKLVDQKFYPQLKKLLK